MEQYKYVLTGAAVPTAKRRVRRFLLGYLPTAYCPELTHREKKPVVLAVCVPQSCGLESPIGPLAAPTLKKPQGNIEKLSHTVSWEVEGCQPKPNERCLLSSLLGRDQPWAANERRSHTGGGSSSRMRADAPALLAFLTLTSSTHHHLSSLDSEPGSATPRGIFTGRHHIQWQHNWRQKLRKLRRRAKDQLDLLEAGSPSCISQLPVETSSVICRQTGRYFVNLNL
eukprot:s5787_g3.t1